MPPSKKSEAAAIGTAIAAVLAPLPSVDKAKVKLVNARSSKARAEWNKISRQIRRNLKSKAVSCVKLHDTTSAELSVDQITAAYKNCVDVGSHPNWNSQVHSADNLAILREADIYLYDLISESYANDDQVTAQLHVLEDSAPNPGIASYEYLDRQFGSTEIEDTMPMLLKIVEKELIAGATIAEFVQAFTLQQTAIEAAYTVRAADGSTSLSRQLLLDHLWGVLAYSRLPDGIRRSLKSQLLSWSSAQFNATAVMKAATKDGKIEAALPADSDNREIAALVKKVETLSAALDEEHSDRVDLEEAMFAGGGRGRNFKTSSSMPRREPWCTPFR